MLRLYTGMRVRFHLTATFWNLLFKAVLQRSSSLTCFFLAAIFVAGLGLSPQAYGVNASLSGHATAAEDCCCHAEPSCDVDVDVSENDCCPQPSDSEECPCSCPCSCCKVTTRTVNLLTLDASTTLLEFDSANHISPVTDARPKSVSLGVDIQPPIA